MNNLTSIKKQIAELSNYYHIKYNAKFNKRTYFNDKILQLIKDYDCTINNDVIDLSGDIYKEYIQDYDATTTDIINAVDYVNYISLRIEF